MFRADDVAGQELTFRSLKLQLEDQIVPAVPNVRSYERRANDEIVQRRGMSPCTFGALAGAQIELGDYFPLLWLADEHRTAVELTNDCKDGVVAFAALDVGSE